VIGDGDPKNVTGEALQHSVLTCSIGFAVRAPLSLPGVSRDLLEEAGMPFLQRLSEPFGNHGRESSYRYEKFVRSIVPGGSVLSHTTAGNQPAGSVGDGFADVGEGMVCSLRYCRAIAAA